MTFAPDCLLSPRRLLLAELGPYGLTDTAVGIVGDPAHRGGYHCGSDRVVTGDYSVTESTRDRNGLTLAACGLDVGQFRYRDQAGRIHDLRSFSRWVVAECEKGAPDTLDIREVIYSPDGVVVRRWDRLGRRTTGDGSHLYHTHFSFFRDAIKAGRDQSPLFRRYLTSAGLIATPIVEVPDMDAKQAEKLDEIHAQVTGRGADADYALVVGPGGSTAWAAQTLRAHSTQLAAINATLAALAGRDFTDEPTIVAGVLAGLDPAAIAAAIPPAIAAQVADELARRIAQ